MAKLNETSTDLKKLVSEIQNECSCIFSGKLKDYGATWLLFRDISLADQLWIKIRRIRTLEQLKDKAAVNEGRDIEFIGLINYAVIMLMKFNYSDIYPDSDYVINNTAMIDELSHEKILTDYKRVWDSVCDLMERKNHDYGAAWMEMHPFSITDQIVTKVHRIKNIINNKGHLLISENIDAQLMDIINYSIFGLIMSRNLMTKNH